MVGGTLWLSKIKPLFQQDHPLIIKMKNNQRKKVRDARETNWSHETKQGKMILDMPVDVDNHAGRHPEKNFMVTSLEGC